MTMNLLRCIIAVFFRCSLNISQAACSKWAMELVNSAPGMASAELNLEKTYGCKSYP